MKHFSSDEEVFSGRIIFDHMPKTAGQAVNAWLVSELGDGCVTPNLVGSHDDLIRQYGGRYSVISAHVDFDNKSGLDPRYQYVTLLREPVDRAISWLFFVINSDSPDNISYVRRVIESEGLDIPAEILPSISNHYVRHFSSVLGMDGGGEQDAVTSALAAVKRYDVVGLYDDMSAFMAGFAGLIGVAPPEALPRVNVSVKRPAVEEVSPEFRARLAAINALDIELFARVREWLPESAAAVGHSVSARDATNFPVTRKWKKYSPPPERIVETTALSVLNARLRSGASIPAGSMMTFEVDIQLTQEVRELVMGIHILDGQRRRAFGVNSSMLGQSPEFVQPGVYRISHNVVASLPAGQYVAGFAFDDLHSGRWRQLAWHDCLCEFEVVHPASRLGVGYATLATSMTFAPRISYWEPVNGQVRLDGSMASMVVGPALDLTVEVSNRGPNHWQGTGLRPLYLSYHWRHPDGEMAIFEGERSDTLPGQSVPAGQSLVTSMRVVPPAEPGAYMLELTLVQENVAWLEDIGLDTYRCAVQITEA